MSSTIDDVMCPNCGQTARQEQDTATCELHVYCPSCGYESEEDEYDYDSDTDDEDLE